MKVILSVISLCFYCPFLTAADPKGIPPEENVNSEKLASYYFDQGVDEGEKGNHAKAFQWFKKAAEQGIVPAQFNLGLMYLKGEGVLQDYKQAFKWYTKAAEQGHALAQFNLGLMYRQGHGALQDYKQAVKWYTKSAEQGFADAQYNLGVLYALGNGVLKDTVTAYSWANIAAANGHSSKLRELLTKQMTPEQIAEGQKLSREMVKANPKLLGN